MSDDFDKNDDLDNFEWDDEPVNGGEDDDAEPGDLGFTGMLSWRQDADEDGQPSDEGDDLDIDWNNAESPVDDEDDSASPADLGFTEMLSWRQDTADNDQTTDNGDDGAFFDDDPALDDQPSGITGMLFGGEADDEDDGAFFDDDPALDDQPSGITGMLFGGEADDEDDGAFFDDDQPTADDERFTPGAGDLGGTQILNDPDNLPDDGAFFDDDADTFDDLFGDLEEEPTIASNEMFTPPPMDAEPFDDEDKLSDFDTFFDDAEPPEGIEDESATPAADAFLASLMDDEDRDDFDFDGGGAGYNVIPDEDLFADIDAEADNLGFMDENESLPDDIIPQQPVDVDFPAEAANDTNYDLDSLLQGYAGEDLPAPLLTGDDDAELFDDFDAVFEQENVLPDDDIDGTASEILSGVRIGDEQASATALIRQRENRPEDELDDRLYALRERAQEQRRLRDIDPTDADEGIAAANFETTPSELTDEVKLNREQRNEVKALREMVAADDITVRDPNSAMTASAEDADMAGFFDPSTEAQQEQDRSNRQRSRRRRRGLQTISQFTERLIVGGVLVAAVMAAYFGFLLFGEPPAANFIDDDEGAAAAVFTNISTIDNDSLVLFSVEYGPNSAAELDDILRNTLTHVITRGGVPVVIGQNPIGVSRVETILAEVATNQELLDALLLDEPLTAGEDYYLVGFLPGGEAGLVNLVQDPNALLTTDIRGEETGLAVASLDDFASILVLADTPDDVRFWAEQVAPSTTTPILGGVARVTEILARQYYLAPDGFDGLLVGQPDANIYNNLLQDIVFVEAAQLALLPTETPTMTFTPSRTPTLTPIGFVPSATPEGFIPSETPEGFEPLFVFGIGTFITTDGSSLNVRQEPSTFSPVVSVLAPSTFVRVQNEDGAGEWTQVIFDDGTEGWVSTALVRVADANEINAQATFAAETAAATTPTATETPTPSPSPTPTETPTATLEPTATTPTDETLPELEPGEGFGQTRTTNTRVFPEANSDLDPVTTLDAGVLLPIRSVGPGTNGLPFAEVRLEDGTIGYILQADIQIDQFPGDVPTEQTSDTVVVAPTATPTPGDGPTVEPIATLTATATATSTPTPTPIPEFLDEGIVIRSTAQTSINARSGPGTEFDRVDILRPGTRLLVTGNSDDGQWVQVQLPTGGTGFVFRQLISVDADSTPPTLAPSPTEPPTLTPTITRTPSPTPIPLDTEGLVAEVTARRALNIRSGPGRGFQSLGPLDRGTVVNVVGVSEDEQWIEIQLADGRTGFVVLGGVTLIPGDTFLRNATATAEAGGEAAALEDVTTATILPTVAPGATETEEFVPGRVQLPTGTRAIVRGIDRINVRANPTRFTQVVTILNGREQVDALTISADGRWLQIRRSSGEVGWVSRPLLAVSLPTTVTPFQGEPAGTVEPRATAIPPTATPTTTNTPTPTATIPPTVTPSPTVDPFADSKAPHRRVFFSRNAAPDLRYRQQENTGTIAEDGVVQVREGAGLFFESLATAAPGEPVTILGTSDDEAWVQVRLSDGTEGFVQVGQVEQGDATAPGTTPQPGTATVIATITQALSAPNISADVVQPLAAGDTVLISAVIGDYAEVTLNNAPAFVLTNTLDIATFPASDGELGAATVFVDADVNLQAAPNTDSTVVGTTTVGAEVAVLGLETVDDTDWAQIRLEDTTQGFVLAAQLRITDFAFQTEPTAETDLARVTAAGTVNIRSGPSLAFGVVGEAEPGAELPVVDVTTTEDEGEWVQVELADGTLGFLQATTVEINPAAPTTVAISPPDVEAEPAASDVVEGSGIIVAGDTVNLRSIPSLDGEVVGDLASGETIPVLAIEETVDEGNWVQVRLEDGTVGFIQADTISITDFSFFVLEEPEPTALQVADGVGVGTIIADNAVNVRAGPGATFSVVAGADPNTVIEITEQVSTEDEGDWLRIRLPNNTEGWVAAFLVDVQQPPGEPTAIAQAPTNTPAPTEPTATDTPAETVTRTGSGDVLSTSPANVRSGPGLDQDVVGSAEPSATIDLLAFASGEDGEAWLRVRLPDGTEGFVQAEQINITVFPPFSVDGADETETEIAAVPTETPTATTEPNAVAQAPTAAPATQTGAGDVIATGTVNVRSGPSLGFDAVGGIAPGDTVDVLAFAEGDDSEQWLRIRLSDGTEGFVQAEQINITVLPPLNLGENDDPTPTATTTVTPTVTAVATEEATEEPTTTEEATEEPTTTEEATEEPTATPVGGTAVALAPDARSQVFGPFYSQRAGEAQLTAERRELAVRVGLIVSALLIALGNLFYALARREK
jgi:uncharacterized protein YgiM (DUF1202 family)